MLWLLPKNILLTHSNSVIGLELLQGRIDLELRDGSSIPAEVLAQTTVWPNVIFLATRHVLTHKRYSFILTRYSVNLADWYQIRCYLLHNQSLSDD